MSDDQRTARRRPLRVGRISLDEFVLSSGGPLPYMVRLRQIETLAEWHEQRLRDEWRALAVDVDDAAAFARRWRRAVAAWSFVEVNELIDLHNRWYPVETRLPMDVRTGDFVRINGQPYRRDPLDAAWALERFPPVLALARDAEL